MVKMTFERRILPRKLYDIIKSFKGDFLGWISVQDVYDIGNSTDLAVGVDLYPYAGFDLPHHIYEFPIDSKIEGYDEMEVTVKKHTGGPWGTLKDVKELDKDMRYSFECLRKAVLKKS